MMTEEPESYQRKLQSLVSKAQQVRSCIKFHICRKLWLLLEVMFVYAVNKILYAFVTLLCKCSFIVLTWCLRYFTLVFTEQQ